jgi:hypothetical protein
VFKPNEKHKQHSMFESSEWMDPRIRKKLEKSWAPIFYEHVFCNIDEEPFAVLYDTKGSPNFPVNIILALDYIKHMKDCNDLELMDYYNFDYLVNYAIGNRTLGERNLADRTLYYFRKRIYSYCLENPGEEDLLFGQFVNLLKEFSKIAGIRLDEQRTDTTLFMSNIKKAGRISLAYDVLVRAVKAIPETIRTEALSKVLEPDFKTDVLYRSKAAEADSKLTMLLALCNVAVAVLEAVPGLSDCEELRIAKRFLNEQAIMNTDGNIIAKSKNDISSNSLQSAFDEDATYRTKGYQGQSGYALELSETCGKDNPFQLITDYAVEPNIVHDVEILKKRLPIIKENTGCIDMYVDGGFHSEDVHKVAEENEIEIHLTNMSGTKPSKYFSPSEYEFDEDTDVILKCPGGHVPIRAVISKGQSVAYFSHDVCSNCPQREKCHSKEQKKNCVVRINVNAIRTSREREAMKLARVENTSKRAGIEGTNSALKRKGQKKLDVRGIVKSEMVSGLKVTAQNIKRIIKYMQGGYEHKSIPPTDQGVLAPTPG